MKLKKLLKDLSVEIRGTKELEITGLSNNSKRVVPGHLFIARKGLKEDGQLYIEEAIHNGAQAIVCEHYNPFLKQVSQILCSNPHQLEPILADRFYDHPSQALSIIATTGTSGKSTVCSLIQQLLHLLPSAPRCGFIGTVGYDTGQRRYEAEHTTPDAITLQRLLKEMRSYGCRYCAIEATSHGLTQGRLEQVQIRTGVFTNLHRDHLDYHHTMENYAEAKALLFDSEHYGRWMRTAVVNADDPWSERIVARFKGRVLYYGTHKDAELRLLQTQLEPSGSRIQLSYQGRLWQVQTSLIGKHYAMNALAALGALLSEGFALEELLPLFAKVQSVRGRLERIATPRGFVYVDYAHKPEALACALATLRQVYPTSKITCVFGCGGDRDRGKRPMMGQIAQQGSDQVFVTSDNPRSEPPMQIIDQILEGMRPQPSIQVEPDRTKAIQQALQSLQPDEVLLIAGKGHETYQIVGSRVLPFDDAAVVRGWFDSCLPKAQGAN